VKKAAKLIVEKYYTKLGLDFQTNKKICEEVAVIPSKRLRNKIAGFVTHLMWRISKGILFFLLFYFVMTSQGSCF
jgi:small subunit ribosomal protein S17e